MDIGKLLLFGAAGFVAYEYFTGGFASTPAPAPAGGIQPGPTAPVQPPITNPTTTQSLILAAAAKSNPPFTQGNSDQWGYFYKQARGVDAQYDSTMPNTGQQILTFPEWWALASAHGLSGNLPRGGYRRVSY